MQLTTEGSVTFLHTDKPLGNLVTVRAFLESRVILLLHYQPKQLYTHAEMLKGTVWPEVLSSTPQLQVGSYSDDNIVLVNLHS